MRQGGGERIGRPPDHPPLVLPTGNTRRVIEGGGETKNRSAFMIARNQVFKLSAKRHIRKKARTGDAGAARTSAIDPVVKKQGKLGKRSKRRKRGRILVGRALKRTTPVAEPHALRSLQKTTINLASGGRILISARRREQ